MTSDAIGTAESGQESEDKNLPGFPAGRHWPRWLFTALAVALFLFTIYVAGYGWLNFMFVRGIHTGIVLFAAFMLFPTPLANRHPGLETTCNLGLGLLGAGGVSWFIVNFERLSILHQMKPIDMVFGAIVVLVSLEAARRAVGWVIAAIGLAAILYGRYGDLLPGALRHNGFNWGYIIEFIAVGDYGLFGAPIGIVATFVVLFLYFGSLLQATGALTRFMDFAFAISGQSAGGPGKVAVIGSLLFGTVSGSTVANIATSGSMTIPMMRKFGFKPYFAAAVEATASSGGQLVPPVLGATAFLLADYANVSYWYVVACSILPAILFYVLVFVQVDLRARRLGLAGMSRDELPPLGPSCARILPYTIPIVLLGFLLSQGYSTQLSAAVGLGALIATLIVVPSTRLTIGMARDAMEKALRQVISISTACLVAGIIIAMLFMSGLSIRLATLVTDYSNGSLLIALLMTMVVTVVLGMGVVTVGAYLLVAALTVPALIDMGAAPLPAHMFVFYFSVFSAITPPVMVGIFTAASLAESNPWQSAAAAIRLALVGFVLPFIWVFHPSLLGIGEPLEIAGVAFSSLVGVVALGTALEGYFFGNLGIVRRLAVAAGSALLIAPDLHWSLIGLAIEAAVLGAPLIRWFRATSSSRTRAVGTSSTPANR